eukprot:3818_1
MSRKEEIEKKEYIVNGYIREIGLWKTTPDIAKICLLYYDTTLYFKFEGKLYTQRTSFYETPIQNVNGIIFNLVFHMHKSKHKRYRGSILQHGYLSYYLSMNCSIDKVCSVGICYSLNCRENGKYYIDSGRLSIGYALLASHNNTNCSIMLNHDVNDSTFVVECNYNILFIEYYTDNIDDDTYFKFITDYNYKPVKLRKLNKHEIKLTGQTLTDLIYADNNYICQTFMKNDECFCIEYGLDACDGLEVTLKLLRLPASIWKIKFKYQVIHNYPYTRSRNQTKCHTGDVVLGYQFNKIAINMDIMLSDISSFVFHFKFGVLDLYGVDEDVMKP